MSFIFHQDGVAVGAADGWAQVTTASGRELCRFRIPKGFKFESAHTIVCEKKTVFEIEVVSVVDGLVEAKILKKRPLT
ncbi:MAG TPA: hypothetical protein PKC28_04920 [Bdellovibrionales bacterium]|nr:hypothetical protein [Bdellovibrionales bacterium]